MLDPDLYERLKKDFPKLADHQEGTRPAAA
jgi:hypothetical protein